MASQFECKLKLADIILFNLYIQFIMISNSGTLEKYSRQLLYNYRLHYFMV